MQTNLEDSLREMKNISRQSSRRNNQRNINRSNQRSAWFNAIHAVKSAPSFRHSRAEPAPAKARGGKLASHAASLRRRGTTSTRHYLRTQLSTRPPTLSSITTPTKPLMFAALSPSPEPRDPNPASPFFVAAWAILVKLKGTVAKLPLAVGRQRAGPTAAPSQRNSYQKSA
jgi:hypothetical protein